jgi:hypothetical protein
MSNSKSQAYEKVDTFVDIFVDTSGRRAVADGKKEENRPGVDPPPVDVPMSELDLTLQPLAS